MPEEVFGGNCSGSCCRNLGANFYNKNTYSYYCEECALAINKWEPLCFPVEYFKDIEPGSKIKLVDDLSKLGYMKVKETLELNCVSLADFELEYLKDNQLVVYNNIYWDFVDNYG